SSRRRHTRCLSDWSSDVCSSDLSSADVKVVPTGPSRWPIDKDVYLMLEQGSGYIVGTPNYATLTIAGNNQPADTRTWVSVGASRSEERRVGKECNSRTSRTQRTP